MSAIVAADAAADWEADAARSELPPAEEGGGAHGLDAASVEVASSCAVGPGGAQGEGTAALWRLVACGCDAVSEVPAGERKVALVDWLLHLTAEVRGAEVGAEDEAAAAAVAAVAAAANARTTPEVESFHSLSQSSTL